MVVIGRDLSSICKIQLMKHIKDQVEEFHRVAGTAAPTVPSVPDRERVMMRLCIMAEEFLEFCTACDPEAADKYDEILDNLIARFKAATFDKVDIVEVADALGDLDYVVEGSRLEYGIDGAPIAAEIHRSNMAKVDPTTGRMERNDIGKVRKPADWTPPDVRGELLKQGWKP